MPKFTVLLHVPVFTRSLRVHAIRPGATIEPFPVPNGVTVSSVGMSNRALSARLVFIVSVHVLPILNAQSPPHVRKTLGAVAFAVSVTEVPSMIFIEQLPLARRTVIKQFSPTGLVTEPVPFPVPIMVSVRKARRVTPTVRACDVAIVQVAPMAALQSFVHDNSSESVAGVVVSATDASPGKVKEHVPVSTEPFTVQSTPAGTERTVACPDELVDTMVSAAGSGTERTDTVLTRPAVAAVIVAVPVETAVTNPLAFTDITPKALLLQLTVRVVMMRCAPSSTAAESCIVRVISKRNGSPVTTALAVGASMRTNETSFKAIGVDTIFCTPGLSEIGPTVWRSTAALSSTSSISTRTTHSSAAGAATTPAAPVGPARDASARQAERSMLIGTFCVGTSDNVMVCVLMSTVAPPCLR